MDHARHYKNESNGFDYGGMLGAAGSTGLLVCLAVTVWMGPVPSLVCTAVASGALEDDDKFFCSELVLQAYADAGLSIADLLPQRTSPEGIVEVASRGKLFYLGHLPVGA